MHNFLKEKNRALSSFNRKVSKPENHKHQQEFSLKLYLLHISVPAKFTTKVNFGGPKKSTTLSQGLSDNFALN